jgi:hypothetical protein
MKGLQICFDALYDYVDYFVVNGVSNLLICALQDKEPFDTIVANFAKQEFS